MSDVEVRARAVADAAIDVLADDDASDDQVTAAIERARRAHREAQLTRRARADERTRRFAEVERALERLAQLSSSAELLDAVCREAVACGFRRTMLARVTDGDWVPWKASFGEGEFARWLKETRIPLEEMRGYSPPGVARRPALVRTVEGNPEVHPELLRASRSTSYVTAPITPAGRALGFLYADHYPDKRTVDEVDRDVLWEFAERFGREYERTALRERLTATRGAMKMAFDAADEIMVTLGETDIALKRQDERGPINPQPLTVLGGQLAPDGLLTPREDEVLRLMTQGYSNRAIAEHMVIREGTVKSHVKNILRKLGATNRTEVIARALGLP